MKIKKAPINKVSSNQPSDTFPSTVPPSPLAH